MRVHTNMLQTKPEVSGNFTDCLCIVMQSIVIGIHCEYKGSSANIHHGPVQGFISDSVLNDTFETDDFFFEKSKS
jgi:hypothetical protein